MFSTYGMIGAAVGLAWALIDWLILLPLLQRPLVAGIAAAAPADRARQERRLTLVRFIFGLQFIIFPVVGYVIGGLLAPEVPA